MINEIIKIRLKLLLVISLILIFSCSENNLNSSENDDENPPEWRLVWSDKFDSLSFPDTTKWLFDVGGHGWGNEELQYYTENRLENTRIENGKLIIQARKEEWQGSQYTSSRMVTRHKGDWTYGRFVIKAKLPAGRGTWPAIWMLPTEWTYGDGGWPDNGEIDIMEHVGYDPGTVHAAIHCNKYNHSIGTQIGSSTIISDFNTEFHEYILEWSEDSIKAFVDDHLYFTVLNEKKGWEYWPFDKDFHLILNIAVGGTWGGAQGVDDSIFPQRMEVDYVCVYQLE